MNELNDIQINNPNIYNANIVGGVYIDTIHSNNTKIIINDIIYELNDIEILLKHKDLFIKLLQEHYPEEFI
jgi:hypothetical protein